ncbi:prolyl oligopeptidase family serine peptidase [Haliscomenobacter hydrossis]|uniref:Acyl-peptide hydrolase n=1 Tax=Haliscomenobacter hydrossis (strain ATCC 27775 / DSM 1100 / LMG 10767 / O) TaxID=760192 RepID=F4KQP1_HALH1|nr:prolyl oligopeptidase family serine peptidase [Haliscomenobacter hydrossis]AEE51014.1 dipeptidyl aminopeptidase [Haliscomenobacter hydrossis DSM 1100]
MKKLLLCSLWLLANGLLAQPSIELLLAQPFPTNLTASADGKNIAWVFNDNGSRNVYSASGVNFNDGARITGFEEKDNGIDISELSFTPSGKHVVFVRGNTPNGQGYAANPAQLQMETSRFLYMTDLEHGRDLRKIAAGYAFKIAPDGRSMAYLNAGQVWLASLVDTVVKPQVLFKIRGGVSALRWNPDGSKLAFVNTRGDHSFIGIYDLAAKSISFPDPSADKNQDPVWSPDGEWLAYIRNPIQADEFLFAPRRTGFPWSIRLLHVKTGEVKEIWKADEGKGSVLVGDLPAVENKLLWAKGQQIIFPWEKDGWVHLNALDIEKKSAKLLTPGAGEVENVVLAPDGQTLYYSCNIGDLNRRHIWKMDINTAQAEQITEGEGIEWSPIPTGEGLALLHASASKPAWPALYTNGGFKDLATAFSISDYPTDLVQPQQISIKATDGMNVPAQLFLPPNHKAGEKHPAVIFLHGGSRRQMLLGFNYSQYYSNAYALNQYFALKGYVVIALNFRSGIGYGLDFREALNYGRTGASEVNDLIGAGEYLKTRADVDPKRIGLWGGSYGGYLTAHGLARRSDLFAAGVDIHGVHNWNKVIPTFNPSYDPLKYPVIAKKAFESSPMFYAAGWKSPVLFIHGDDDRNVIFSETEDMIKVLRQRKVPFEQLIFPDEVHSFLLQRSWVKAYEATFEFLDRQMKQK